MKEISYEFAKYNGLLPDSLERAYKAVEGCSILSPATDRAFELAYRDAEKENRCIRFVNFRGEKLKIMNKQDKIKEQVDEIRYEIEDFFDNRERRKDVYKYDAKRYKKI